MTSVNYLEARTLLERTMREHFTVTQLTGLTPESFEAHVTGLPGLLDADREGYQDASRQRDLSIKFHWGHDHDFGAFQMRGRMANRHIHILARLIAEFDFPTQLRGERVLDVGVWTGGTSLLLAAMGADVSALEEVGKYADTVNWLAAAFALEKRLACRSMSLFHLDDHDRYDRILYSGVVYHVTDPLLSLRLLFNALKDGGVLYVETFATDPSTFAGPGDASAASVEGPDVIHSGSVEALDRGGWNYFVPTPAALGRWLRTVGFEDVKMGEVDAGRRLLARATRRRHVDMLRAGLSRPDVR